MTQKSLGNLSDNKKSKIQLQIPLGIYCVCWIWSFVNIVFLSFIKKMQSFIVIHNNYSSNFYQ